MYLSSPCRFLYLLVSIFSSLLTTAQNVSLQDSLIGYYTFSGNTSDSSGHQHHGTNFGATYTTDRFGNPNEALLFDGINDSVIVGNIIDVSKQQGMSFTAWFQPSTSIQQPNRNVGVSIGRKNRGEMAIRYNDERNWQLVAAFGDGAEQIVNSNHNSCKTGPVTFGQWYHVAGVFENGKVTLYVDAEEQSNCKSNKAGGKLSHIHPNALLRIGKAYNSYNTEKLFKGKIDDVRIYNRAISYCEVTHIYGDSSLILKASKDTIICQGEQVKLQAFGGGNYLWSTGEKSNTITVSPSNPTMYYIQDTKRGCIDSAFVDVYPSPKASFTADTVIGKPPLTVNFTNTSVGGTSYMWDFGDGQQDTSRHTTHTFTSLGIYHVSLTVENEFGCKSKASQTIKVIEDFNIIIPNVFTPNNDGQNDLWDVTISGLATDISCTVSSRWGNEVYRHSGDEISWDGTHEGKPVSDGVYFYLINLKTFEGELKRYKGFIHLFH